MRITVKKGQGACPNIIQTQVTLPEGFKSISQRSKVPKKDWKTFKLKIQQEVIQGRLICAIVKGEFDLTSKY